MTLPALPHAMQCHKPLSGETMKLGVSWSLWNGQRPMKSFAPCFFNSTPRLCASATRSVSRLTRSMSASGMRQGIASVPVYPLAGGCVVLAPQAIGLQEPVPAFFSGPRRAQRQLYHAPTLVIPAAQGFQTVVPPVIVVFAHGQPAQARQVLGHARRQRVP